MAKSKPTIPTKGFGASKGQLIAELSKAHAQMRRQNWDQAIKILQNLETKYPNEPDVYISQINLYYEIGDMMHYQYACEQLLGIQPNNADATLGLAGSYLANVRPMLALQTFRRFVETWPQHKKAEDVRKTINELETQTTEIITELGVTGPDAQQIATLHEKAHGLLEINKYLEAREIEEKILKMRPDFVPALNNISQSYWMEGNLKKAIELCQKVLEINPQNYHALSNISRYLVLNGNIEAAKQEAEKLKDVESELIDIWLKKAEAFSFLGEDDRVLEAYTGAEKAGLLEGRLSPPLMYHLAGCAELRKGNQNRARKLWEKALEINPNFYLSQVNLNDLNLPVSQRNAPWPFPLANWISKTMLDDLLKAVQEGFKGEDEEAAQKTTLEYLKQHPEVEKLIPILLDRGDPQAREFALRLAKMAKTPELLEILKTFAFGQRGSDESRYDAAVCLKQAGILPSNNVKMWMKGEWTDLVLFGFEITDEPTVKHSPKVLEMLAEANKALKQAKPEKAELLLKKCLEIEPESPSLLNNLASAWEQLGRKEEAKNLILEIYEKNPDYVFTRAAVALFALQAGEIEIAEELMAPLVARSKFHPSEFVAFCNVQIEIFLAKDQPEGAKTWLQMWEDIYPEHPRFSYWKKRLKAGG